MKPKFRRYAEVTPQMLADLADYKTAASLGAAAYPTNPRIARAFAFGWRFRGYAKGMTTYEIDAAQFGHEAHDIDF